MKKSLKIKKLVGISILLALVVVLQLMSNYIQFSVSITLAITPVIIGAMLYGPFVGLFLGAIQGLLIFLAPSTIAGFWPVTVFGTLVVCILKTGIAGFVSGLLFKMLYKKNLKLSVTLASVLFPIINTGLFVIAAATVFASVYAPGAASEGKAVLVFILGQILVNFIIEFAVNSLLSPTVLYLIRISSKNYNLGSNLDINE